MRIAIGLITRLGGAIVLHQTGRIVLFDVAGADKLTAGFDHQFTHFDITADLAGRHNFQPVGVYLAVHVTTDQHPFGFDVTFEAPGLADRDIAAGVDIALHFTVEVKVIF